MPSNTSKNKIGGVAPNFFYKLAGQHIYWYKDRILNELKKGSTDPEEIKGHIKEANDRFLMKRTGQIDISGKGKLRTAIREENKSIISRLLSMSANDIESMFGDIDRQLKYANKNIQGEINQEKFELLKAIIGTKRGSKTEVVDNIKFKWFRKLFKSEEIFDNRIKNQPPED